MPDKTVGCFNGQALRWTPGDAAPHVDLPEGRRYLHGLALSYTDAFSGIPELTDDTQVGAVARWGAVFYLKADGTWQANSTCGTWWLSDAT